MSQQQIMEKNLAKLLSQHQSLPQLCDSEPADPFQKIHFGRKMKRSKANSTKIISQSINYNSNICSLFPEAQNAVLPHNLQYIVDLKSEAVRTDELQADSDFYEGEIEGLFKRLRNKVDQVEESFKNRFKQIRRHTNDNGQDVLNEMLGNLEGSIDFIINDCLKSDFYLKKHSNNDKLARDTKRTMMTRMQDCNKENVRSNNCKKAKLVANHKGKINEKGNYESQPKPGEKSIYQSVLEEREQRRNRKKMI